MTDKNIDQIAGPLWNGRRPITATSGETATFRDIAERLACARGLHDYTNQADLIERALEDAYRLGLETATTKGNQQ